MAKQEIPPNSVRGIQDVKEGQKFVDEAEVFHRLHHPVTDFTTPDQIEEFAHHLGEDLSNCEAYPFYRSYLEEQLPTLEILERSVSEMKRRLDEKVSEEKAAGASEETTKELSDKARILSIRLSNIRNNTSRYVQTVARFHEMKSRVKYSDPDWQKGEFQRIDIERKRAHDILLNSLRDLVVKAQEVREEGLLSSSEIGLWDRTKSAKDIEKDGKIVLFHPRVIDDRDYIRDWAIAADMDMQMRAFAARQQELRQSASGN